jgi:hypothetical protein
METKNHDLNAKAEMNRWFCRNMEIDNILCCFVDRIDVLRMVWQAPQDKVLFFAEGRMRTKVLRKLTACDVEYRTH